MMLATESVGNPQTTIRVGNVGFSGNFPRSGIRLPAGLGACAMPMRNFSPCVQRKRRRSAAKAVSAQVDTPFAGSGAPRLTAIWSMAETTASKVSMVEA